MPKPITALAVAGVLGLAALVIACVLAPAPPSGDPSIRGTITSAVSADTGEVSLMVEAQGRPAYDYDKASVRVSAKTAVLRATGAGTYESASIEDLKPGVTVDVWFEGPVAESYPVQATAGAVVILD